MTSLEMMKSLEAESIMADGDVKFSSESGALDSPIFSGITAAPTVATINKKKW